jgi:hypothetical protein
MRAKHFMSVVAATAGRFIFAAAIFICANFSRGQGAGVPVYTWDSYGDEQILSAAEKLFDTGKLVRETVLTNQLYGRKSCELKLSALHTEKLAGRELWSVARAAHVRVGWYYRTTRNDEWRVTMAAGYALTTNGAVATCYHVARAPENCKEAYLIAVGENGQAYPVTEILAANADADACILRVAANDLKPLALNTNVFPGDRCVCYSDPMGERGYFSDGVVSRFLSPHRRDGRVVKSATRLDVTTEWAPGSSGAAVLDESGNAIGHVSMISNLSSRQPGIRGSSGPLITIHEAVSARDVLALVKPASK